MAIKDTVDKSIEKVGKEEEKRERGKENLKEKGLSTPWKALPVAAQLADAITTEVGLRKGLKENNPTVAGLTKKPALSIAAKAALGAGTSFVADKIAKKYGGKWGKIVAGAASAPPAIAAANNTRLILGKKSTKGKR